MVFKLLPLSFLNVHGSHQVRITKKTTIISFCLSFYELGIQEELEYEILTQSFLWLQLNASGLELKQVPGQYLFSQIQLHTFSLRSLHVGQFALPPYCIELRQIFMMQFMV